MTAELDHVFILTRPGAPEAQALIDVGLRESAPNDHPGQGTACRRFSFRNAMIELLWVADEQVARDASALTKLWDRWHERSRRGASPFGVVMRPVEEAIACPFPSREYRPAYLSAGEVIQIGDAALAEPLWAYMSFLSRAMRERRFEPHACGVRQITSVRIAGPEELRSAAAQYANSAGVCECSREPDVLMEIRFDDGQRMRTVDFRPELPLKMSW